MAEDQWARMWELFHRAIELEREARDAYLDESCAGDPALRAELQDLLASYDPAAEHFEGSLLPASATGATEPDLVGITIGEYRLLRILGEGGMGIVYEAEQEEPVRRRVALKLIRLGMNSREITARFESERQALALMQHPNIATVLGGGSTADGRPYFVMELVDGAPITRFCDCNRLGLRQRLELFVRVCRAVEHAHRKGVIHRDLKPSNILVVKRDREPLPKVIDFGIAKALGGSLSARTMATRLGAAIGTPEYMSPEQAGVADDDEGDVDTRADVYSLGALLYELLTGSLPFDFSGLSELEVLRVLQRDEPRTPSIRVRTQERTAVTTPLATGLEPRSLHRQLKGELDWITVKALEKDRTRRYQSVAELADAAGRHLAHEPVSAGPPGAGYRLTKFVRRNRLAVAAATAVVVALLLGLAAATWMALVARQERTSAMHARDEARREAETAKAINRFIEEMLAAPDPTRLDPTASVAREVKVVEVLDRAGEALETSLTNEPVVRAALHATLGRTYLSLGQLEPAEEQLAQALEMQRKLLGERDRRTLTTMHNLALTLSDLGRYAEAEELLRPALAGRRALFGDEHEDTLASLNSMAAHLVRNGDLEEAERHYREVVDLARRVFGPDHQQTLRFEHNLGQVLSRRGQLEEAEALYRDGLERHDRLYGSSHTYSLSVRSSLSQVLQRQGRLAEAETLVRQAADGKLRTLGPEHDGTLTAQANVAVLLFQQGQYEETERVLRRVLEIRDRIGLGEAPHVYAERNNLARSLLAQGRAQDALVIYERLLPEMRQRLPPRHVNHALIPQGYALCLLALGRRDEAETVIREAYEHLLEVLGPEHARTKQAKRRLEELRATGTTS